MACLREGKENLKWLESNNPIVACHNSGEIDKNWIIMINENSRFYSKSNVMQL